MKIIKLNAIDSTNSFLKDLAQNSTLENYTVAITEDQTKGRGQQESKWVTAPLKNLTFSIFVKFNKLRINQKRYLNFAISLAIYDALLEKKIDKISIKWPNDIMAANKKICGILIENTFIGDRIKNSITGIGLNVNQEIFPEYLKNVTSLKLEKGFDFNLNNLLNDILIKIQEKIKLLENNEFDLLENSYLNVLYKKNIPTMFKNCQNEIFIGIIYGISTDGKLQIQLEDDSIKEFGIKEVSFL
ncbi:biotin--[acetyl-CoA-carboxylase] ligase [Polaribacter aquimarinus]|uniref:Biotin--[acetyl-CoA-carboxylase] ligase n=1 Tax=Polaribacter aquimarinus TaxID=2100726 RepID=A0A2U2JDL1_9FLAO|nr:biotin--[acetyl-CoA-carboxylase] ligase [Polaribacter aquimarinus]PWG06428.1 biotin--[acetyl-CoA-carboxylase] ligase [Polaribacter aquimarinus]